MTRAWRIEYEGALYHVLSRGNERRNIVVDDKDRTMFLDTVYTKRFNTRHFRSGHLFQGRFKNMLVQNDAYLMQLSYSSKSSPGPDGEKIIKLQMEQLSSLCL